MECWSTGVRGFTTLHTDDVRKIPDRILNMMENRLDAERMENDVYTYVDVGVLLRIKKDARGKRYRYIDQVCFFSREQARNEITMMVVDGQTQTHDLPIEVEKKMRQAGIKNGFYQEEVAWQMQQEQGDLYESAC